MVMSPDTLDSEIGRYLGIEELPRKPQRVAAKQRRGADWPLFSFRLPRDQALADVAKVLGSPNRRRRRT
jgi:hypothetical protein